MSASAPNPERLLLALDARLDHEVRLILYGRSAVWLGFNNPPAAAATTQDVDGIIPLAEVQALAEDMQFWDARDAVNEHFKSEGLYHHAPVSRERSVFAARLAPAYRFYRPPEASSLATVSACNCRSDPDEIDAWQ